MLTHDVSMSHNLRPSQIVLPLVSRANLGISSWRGVVKSCCCFFFFGLSDSRAGTVFGRAAFGAPRATGATVNRFSTLALVGRSSKVSSSVPSPKLRFLVGWVSVPILAASLRRCSGARVGGVSLLAVVLLPVDELGEWRGVDRC